MRHRLFPHALLLALAVAACGGETEPDQEGDPGSVTTTTTASTTSSFQSTQGDGDPTNDPPSALNDMNHPSFPEPLVDTEQIISGGPPPDGIPSIDSPEFVTVDEADEWIDDDEPVIYVDLVGEVHAYPVQILIWHEIVNDDVGGVPVAVTYCPLCNTAVSYKREVDGRVTEFGTSGRLYASALVMYDRLTESLWTHFDGRAVVGVETGAELETISSPLLSWADFREAFPDAEVLDRDATGYERPYGQNPYAGYDDPQSQPFLFRGNVDDRAAAMQRVVGVSLDDAARAWSLDAISGGEAMATNSAVGSEPVAVFWKAGQSSALEGGSVSGGRDVGSVAVYSPVIDGERLSFEADGDFFVDEQTGSEWDITGTATSGELAGTSLEQIQHLDTFWFAWSTYQPETDLVDA